MITSNKELIDIISKNEKVYFYGAGKVGQATVDFLKKNYDLSNISGFVETNCDEGKMLLGINIASIKKIDISGKTCVIVTTRSNLHDSIRSTLRDVGISKAEYLSDEYAIELLQRHSRANAKFAPLSSIKNIEDAIVRTTPQVSLNYFVLNILDHCNLNCRGCDHFASIANERFIPFDTVKRDLKRFSEIMGGEAKIIGIMGGEPLLHPDLNKIVEATRSSFPSSRIQIDTNGILLLKQNENFWDTCRDNNVVIVNTKYPINIDHEEIERKCHQEDVAFEYYGNSGQVLKTLFKVPLDLEGNQDPRRSFMKCAHANNCVTLQEGRIYPCTIAPNAHIFNEKYGTKLKISEEDSLSIYREGLTKKDILEFVSSPIPFCRYCDVQHRSFGHEWGVSTGKIDEWVLTECEKHPREKARIQTPREKIKFEVHLAEHCNLNCRGCFHYSSIAKEELLSADEYEKDCTRISELYKGEASQILLLGGEPLLNPEVNRFMDITRGKFPTAEIILVTNAILLPNMSDEFWECCNKNNVHIEPTKYPLSIDYGAIEEKAKKHNVYLKYFNNGNIEKKLTFQPIDISGSQDMEDNFYGCYRANLCITLKHGRLYTCIIPAHIHHFAEYFNEKLPDFETDGIDIYEAGSAEEISNFLTKPIEACKYCDRRNTKDGFKWGITDKSKKEWVFIE